MVYDAGQTAATTMPSWRRRASGSSGRCRSDHPGLLAIPARDYRIVDPDRYPGLRFVDTTVTALGVTRRALLTHSANLHAKQSRGLDQTLAKARRRLAELQARRPRRDPPRPGRGPGRDRHDLQAPLGRRHHHRHPDR